MHEIISALIIGIIIGARFNEYLREDKQRMLAEQEAWKKAREETVFRHERMTHAEVDQLINEIVGKYH